MWQVRVSLYLFSPQVLFSEYLCLIRSDTAHNACYYLRRAKWLLGVQLNKDKVVILYREPLENTLKLHVHFLWGRSIKWQDLRDFLLSFFFLSKSLVRGSEMHWRKMDALFSQPNSAGLSALTECVPSRQEKNTLYLHFGSLPQSTQLLAWLAAIAG